MSNDDDPSGYKNPPKDRRFKKGQSGCPDGGHKKRAANKRAKEEKERKNEGAVRNAVLSWFSSKRRAKLNGKLVLLNKMELALAQLEEDVFLKRDAQARKLFFDIAQKNDWLKAPPPSTHRSGVLVVYPVLKQEAWIEATEGQLLTKDPLEGIPGYDPEEFQAKPRGRSAEDDEDDNNTKKKK